MVSKTQLRILRRSSVGSCNSGARLVPILSFKTVGTEAWWKTVAPFRSVNVGDDVTSLLPMRRSLQSEMGMDTIGDSEAYVGRGIEGTRSSGFAINHTFYQANDCSSSTTTKKAMDTGAMRS